MDETQVLLRFGMKWLGWQSFFLFSFFFFFKAGKFEHGGVQKRAPMAALVPIASTWLHYSSSYLITVSFNMTLQHDSLYQNLNNTGSLIIQFGSSPPQIRLEEGRTALAAPL
ncbi:hypothetical protein ACQKWADRAFT_290874, partial [Trichoderma austrokoningii]